MGMVNFTGEVPNHIKKLFTEGVEEDVSDEASLGAKVINTLKESFNYMDQIKFDKFSLCEKFKAIKTTDSSKREIYELGLRLLFGTNCPSTERQQLAQVLDEEFLSLKTSFPDLFAQQLNDAWKLLSFFPEDKRNTQTIQGVIDLFKNIPDAKLREEILVELDRSSGTPIDLQYVEALTSLFKAERVPFHRGTVLTELSHVPLKERGEVLSLFNTMMQGLEDRSIQRFVMETICGLPKLQRTEIISQMAPVIQVIQEGITRARILEEFKVHPQEQIKKEYVEAIVDLYKATFGTFTSATETRELILTAANRVPQDERVEFIRHSISLVKRVTYQEAIKESLEALRDVPFEKRLRIVNLVAEIGLGPYDQGRWAAVIRIAGMIPQDQLDNESIVAIRIVCQSREKRTLTNTVRLISPEKRMEAIRILMQQNDLSQVGRIFSSRLFATNTEIKRASHEYILRTFDEAIQFFKETGKIQDNSLKLSSIVIDRASEPHLHEDLSILRKAKIVNTVSQPAFSLLIPSDKREEVIQILMEHPELYSENDSLQKIFRLNEGVRNATIKHLQNILSDILPNQAKAFQYSKAIIENANALLLHEEHPLLQRAYEVAAIADPEALNNKKNPYRLFKEIKEKLAAEPEYKADTAFNIATLRRKGENQGFTIKDLPQNISLENLEQLFDRLEKRLTALPETERQAVEKYIQESFTNSIGSLKGNLLGKPLIPSLLLSIKGGPDQPVEASAMQMCMILKMIVNESPLLEKGMLLSPQEELLLRVSTSINACSTGQRDGIFLYYNQLPPQYRLGKGTTSDEEKVSHLVDQSVQVTLNQIFESEELLKVIRERPDIQQHSHQTLYLKNRLHRQVGLIHSPIFDPHSGVIYDELIDTDSQKMLKVFFTLFTPIKVADQVKRDVAKAMQSKTISYEMLERIFQPYLLTKKEAGIGHEEAYRSYFDFAEDYTPLGLSDEGIKVLLNTAGYLR